MGSETSSLSARNRTGKLDQSRKQIAGDGLETCWEWGNATGQEERAGAEDRIAQGGGSRSREAVGLEVGAAATRKGTFGKAVPGTESRCLEPDCWQGGREHGGRHWRQKQDRDVPLLRKLFTGSIHPSPSLGLCAEMFSRASLVLGLTSLTWSEPSEKEGP